MRVETVTEEGYNSASLQLGEASAGRKIITSSRTVFVDLTAIVYELEIIAIIMQGRPPRMYIAVHHQFLCMQYLPWRKREVLAAILGRLTSAAVYITNSINGLQSADPPFSLEILTTYRSARCVCVQWNGDI